MTFGSIDYLFLIISGWDSIPSWLGRMRCRQWFLESILEKTHISDLARERVFFLVSGFFTICYYFAFI